MWQAILSAALRFVLRGLGIGGSTEPTAAEIGARAGAAEAKLQDQGAAYDELAKAADARADADVERVRTEPGGDQIDPDPAKHHPGLEFRD